MDCESRKMARPHLMGIKLGRGYRWRFSRPPWSAAYEGWPRRAKCIGLGHWSTQTRRTFTNQNASIAFHFQLQGDDTRKIPVSCKFNIWFGHGAGRPKPVWVAVTRLPWPTHFYFLSPAAVLIFWPLLEPEPSYRNNRLRRTIAVWLVKYRYVERYRWVCPAVLCAQRNNPKQGQRDPWVGKVRYFSSHVRKRSQRSLQGNFQLPFTPAYPLTASRVLLLLFFLLLSVPSSLDKNFFSRTRPCVSGVPMDT